MPFEMAFVFVLMAVAGGIICLALLFTGWEARHERETRPQTPEEYDQLAAILRAEKRMLEARAERDIAHALWRDSQDHIDKMKGGRHA